MAFRNRLKEKLARRESTLGLWVTLESPTITEIAVELEYDWVVIDAEHGHLDFKEILEHLRATRNSDTTALVRIQEIEQGLIKRVLDLGASGILVPQVTSTSDVQQAVRFAKYPPQGIRGVGGERATHWGMELAEYTGVANDEIMVIPLIENVAAGQAIDSILAVAGVDAIFFGPADYSASAGFLGQWEGPGVAQALLRFRDRAHERGIPCGIMSTSVQNSLERRQQGFQLVGLGSDTALLIRASLEAMRAHGKTPAANRR
jgi:2-keto-3-deoxy-L-rhamnonate aldolase RhmA